MPIFELSSRVLHAASDSYSSTYVCTLVVVQSYFGSSNFDGGVHNIVCRKIFK